MPDLLGVRAESSPDAVALVDAGIRRHVELRRIRPTRIGPSRCPPVQLRPGPGRPVRVPTDTGVAFAELYFATARTGATAVLLNVRLDAETLATQAERAGLTGLVCTDETEATAVDVAPDGVPVATLDEPNSQAVRPLELGSEDVVTPVELAADAEQLLIFTSGTTGEPKGVRLTLDNLVSSAVGSAHRLGGVARRTAGSFVSRCTTWAGSLPSFGRRFTGRRRSSSRNSIRTRRRASSRSTTSPVSRSYRRCSNDYSTPGGRRPSTSGSSCSAADRRRSPWSIAVSRVVFPSARPTARRRRPRRSRRRSPRRRSNTAGPLERRSGEPLSVSSTSRERPSRDGDVGEIVVDGPTVTPGYLDEAHTAAAFGPGGFETGDLGYRDEGGRLWVVGRVDDQIVTGGENVQPAAVAATIRSLSGVEDVAVVGIPDEVGRTGRCAGLSAPIPHSPSPDCATTAAGNWPTTRSPRPSDSSRRSRGLPPGPSTGERARSLLAEE